MPGPRHNAKIRGASECRTCGAAITLASDGAWEDESGACGCATGEHAPGGYDAADAAQRARETPWWEGYPAA